MYCLLITRAATSNSNAVEKFLDKRGCRNYHQISYMLLILIQCNTITGKWINQNKGQFNMYVNEMNSITCINSHNLQRHFWKITSYHSERNTFSRYCIPKMFIKCILMFCNSLKCVISYIKLLLIYRYIYRDILPIRVSLCLSFIFVILILNMTLNIYILSQYQIF